jgi:hypothetical protein
MHEFENLVHLVGFITRICHDARSAERQIKNMCRDFYLPYLPYPARKRVSSASYRIVACGLSGCTILFSQYHISFVSNISHYKKNWATYCHDVNWATYCHDVNRATYCHDVNWATYCHDVNWATYCHNVNWATYCHNLNWFPCKVLIILDMSYLHLNFLVKFSKNSEISNFMEVHPIGHTDRQTWRS